jgi:fluoride exporter
MFINGLIVGLGATVGSVLRYGISTGLKKYFYNWQGPWDTLFINVTGAFLLGMVNSRMTPNHLGMTLTIAILGGYTTFSTYMNEVITLTKQPQKKWQACSYYLGSAILGILAAGIGYYI